MSARFDGRDFAKWTLIVVLVGVALWSFFLQGRMGLQAIRPEPGVVTDVLLAPYLEALADAVDADRSTIERRAALGRGYEANELYEPAAATWRQLATSDPDDWTWHYRLAMTLERLGDLEAAIEAMQAASARAPSSAPAPQWRLALWLIDAGRLDEARPVLAQAQKAAPDAAAVLVASVQMALAEERAEDAETLVRQHDLVSTLPGGFGWSLLGRALRHQGRVDEARVAWERAGNVRPRFADRFSREMNKAVGGLRALRNASTAQARAGKWNAVIETTTSVLEYDPGDVVQRRLRGIARFRSGDLDGAQDELEFILTQEEEPSTWWALGSVHLQRAVVQRQPELAGEAIAAANAGLRMDSDHRNLLLLRGRALVVIGRHAEAIETLRTAWDRDRSRRAPLESAMPAIAMTDYWVESIDLAEALWNMVPAHPLAGPGYALALAQLDRGEEAQQVLDALTGPRIDPDLRARAEAALVPSRVEDADAP